MPYVSDFYIPSRNLIIEVCGPHHYMRKVENGEFVKTNKLNKRAVNKIEALERNGYNTVVIDVIEV